jgi:hypothetical protein
LDIPKSATLLVKFQEISKIMHPIQLIIDLKDMLGEIFHTYVAKNSKIIFYLCAGIQND